MCTKSPHTNWRIPTGGTEYPCVMSGVGFHRYALCGSRLYTEQKDSRSQRHDQKVYRLGSRVRAT